MQRFLAMAGVDSRRNCEEYIRTGRVQVNGEVVTDPARAVEPEDDDIRLDSGRLRLPRFRYFLVNKPPGVVCTNFDPGGRPRAVDLVPARDQRLFTVGRLDESTMGLLLITNDGDLAERMAHPRFEVVRRYRCQVAGIPDHTVLQQLRDGMYFADGFFRFQGIRIARRLGRSAILELELREGRNREIRRLMARVGHKVIALQRVAFGPLRLGSLAPGEYRELHGAELKELRSFLISGGERTDLSSNRDGPRNQFGYRPGKTRRPGHRGRRKESLKEAATGGVRHRSRTGIRGAARRQPAHQPQLPAGQPQRRTGRKKSKRHGQ